MYDKKLNFYNTLELLHCAIKHEILQQDPNNNNNILVYRLAGTESPEGWYSQNVHDVAREMFEDPKCEGQKAIMKELKGRGINPDFTDIEKIMNLPET